MEGKLNKVELVRSEAEGWFVVYRYGRGKDEDRLVASFPNEDEMLADVSAKLKE